MAASVPKRGSGRADRQFEVLSGGGGVVPPMPVLEQWGEPVVWCAEVERAWSAIWESPIAGEIHDIDLGGLHAAMFGLNLYYTSEKPTAAMLTEFRQWSTEFGLTPVARRKMRVALAGEEGDVDGESVLSGRAGGKREKRADPRRS